MSGQGTTLRIAALEECLPCLVLSQRNRHPGAHLPTSATLVYQPHPFYDLMLGLLSFSQSCLCNASDFGTVSCHFSQITRRFCSGEIFTYKHHRKHCFRFLTSYSSLACGPATHLELLSPRIPASFASLSPVDNFRPLLTWLFSSIQCLDSSRFSGYFSVPFFVLPYPAFQYCRSSELDPSPFLSLSR